MRLISIKTIKSILNWLTKQNLVWNIVSMTEQGECRNLFWRRTY